MVENYWLIEIYSDGTSNVSITSKAEIDAMKKKEDIEEWQFEKTSEVSQEEMIEKAEDKGYELDPW